MTEALAFPIGDRIVGDGAPCFVIAELSGNHHQKYEEAVALVKAAKEAGADAVKLQTYTPDTITLDSDKKWFRVGGEGNPESWKGKTLYQLYQETYTPWEWQPKLKKLADELGIILFSTPFDETAVDFLEKELDPPCFKIASYEATDIPLLKKVARTGKPVILSIGYASEDEIREALEILRANGAGSVAVLHCVTAYTDTPDPKMMNLKTIADTGKRFGVVSGFSDNNGGIEFPVMAAEAGASIIEKHFILDKASGGPDARFSITPPELKQMIHDVKQKKKAPREQFEQALGEVHYGPVNAQEEYNKRFRRSLFVAKDMEKGDAFTRENLRDVRPAFGLPTKYFETMLGRRAAHAIESGTPLSWILVEGGETGVTR
jgi:pseudaminic acid synthase